ncbi:MAG: MFS transporter [Actinophytocola sp.]|nr:MFS transporter [Actinophytocola sp.]
MFLAPLYYQVVRGESATLAGLLLIPQALATGLTMQIAGRLIDRVPAHRVIASGLILAPTGFIAFTTQVSAETPYWVLVLALSVAGIGVGATLMPTMTTATRKLGHADVASGATLLNVINQVAVSFGFAMTSVLLATQLSRKVPQLTGGHIGDAYNLPAPTSPVSPAAPSRTHAHRVRTQLTVVSYGKKVAGVLGFGLIESRCPVRLRASRPRRAR